MESSHRHDFGNRSAFITGALIGAGIALLFAPKSGSQLRALLGNYVTHAKDKFDEAVDRGVEMVDNTVDRGHELLEKGRESLHESGRQAKTIAEAASKVADETRNELASRARLG